MPTSSPSPWPGDRSTRRGWRTPVLQFVAVGLLVAVLLSVVTGWLGRRAAGEEAYFDAKASTELLARAVVQPEIPRGLVTERSAAVDRFDRLILNRVISDEVVRVKVWEGDGQIVYSDEPRLIGRAFDLDPEELGVLSGGGTDAEHSDLDEAENVFDQPLGEVVEVYTRVESPEGRPLLFEVYYSSEQVGARTDQVVEAFRPISVGGILLFLGLAVPLVWVLAHRLDAAGRDRETLLLAAVAASDVERRRIARDLHDGVVQDLAGTAFALSASGREAAYRPELRERLEALAGSVRQSLRALRSLLVEIYPPDLHTAGLSAALDDLVAPAAAAGVDVRLEVAETSEVPDEAVGLVWRVAQECVRNALRHGRPSSLSVVLSREPGPPPALVLEVADDGVGFDPDTPPAEGHFGLRALRDLVALTGSRLRVRAARGAGTVVRLEVDER